MGAAEEDPSRTRTSGRTAFDARGNLTMGRMPTQLGVHAVPCAAVPDGLQEAVWLPPVQRNQIHTRTPRQSVTVG
jgi:hypothetical protein